MKRVKREDLLLRLFNSYQYMQDFTENFVRGLDIAIDAFSVFEKLAGNDQLVAKKYKFELLQWRERVIPNFKGMKKNAELALINVNKKNTGTIRSATGNLHGLSKDMDGIGWDWWKEIDSHYWEQYVKHSNKAERMAGNIYRTLSNYWRPGAILKESITGPIRDEQLKAVLEPGETFE